MIKGMDEVIEFIEKQGEEKKELKKEIEKLGEIIIRMGEEIKDLNEEIQLNKYAAIREEQRLDLRAQHAEAHNKILTQKLLDAEKA
tara:strand:- start:1630 stop:1887 length:258 start_codon:yes stop_codon:yes gene_type:complete